LEERLPPGDVLLGRLLSGTWLAPGMGLSAAGSIPALRMQADTGASQDRFAQPSRVMATGDSEVPTTQLVVANTQPAQQEPASRPMGSAGAQSCANHVLPRGYQELSGLDDDALDQLLAEDDDPLSSLPGRQAASKEGHSGHAADLDQATPAAAGGSGAGDATTSSLGQGTGVAFPPLIGQRVER
jgi:hypothetical protein